MYINRQNTECLDLLAHFKCVECALMRGEEGDRGINPSHLLAPLITYIQRLHPKAAVLSRHKPTTNRKWHMGHQINGHVTDDVTCTPKGAVRQYGRLS